MAATLWIDVEDLFEYARTSRRPSGIQRLAFEICRVLYRRNGDRGLVRFVRHDPLRNSLQIVPWAEVARLFSGLTNEDVRPPAVSDGAAGEIRPHSAGRQFVRVWVHRLPAALRVRVIDVLLTQAEALRAWGRLFALLGRVARRRPNGAIAEPAGPPPVASDPGGPLQPFAALVAPGDVLLTLGSPWSHPDYAQFVRLQKERFGLRFALLVYDLIPVRRPEWCDRGLVRLFRAWFAGALPLADHLFAISRATAADVERYAGERGIALPVPVIPIPIGTGFGEPPAAPAEASSAGRLPPSGTYALIVSTIEARKNHLLLFRVWRRLLEDLSPDQVPTLVFAGRVGWLVDDLMQQIANTDNLNGKLVLVLDPTDAELTALYQGCLFTLYPSFFEGWGLPVTESLSFGKPCLMSDRTSLPEAGGTLARSFDPDNLHDAYAVISQTIADRAGLAAWEARVRREFRPVPWSVTVDALLEGLGHPLAGEPAAGQGETAAIPVEP